MDRVIEQIVENVGPVVVGHGGEIVQVVAEQVGNVVGTAFETVRNCATQ
jgi:hypothetical protein